MGVLLIEEMLRRSIRADISVAKNQVRCLAFDITLIFRKCGYTGRDDRCVLRLLTQTVHGNESPSAFATALQLTPLHTSLSNDISLPNWLVRRSYTGVFIFRYVYTVNSHIRYRHPAGNEWYQLHSERFA